MIYMQGVGRIDTLRGDMVMTREVRPAEFVEVKDETGKVVETYQAAPALHYVAQPSKPFPWLIVGAVGLGAYLLLRKPSRPAQFERRAR